MSRGIRIFMGYRQSTLLNVVFSEAHEPLLLLRTALAEDRRLIDQLEALRDESELFNTSNLFCGSLLLLAFTELEKKLRFSDPLTGPVMLLGDI
ncbi:hypothetical protein PUN28_008232 [Cardiocondyla obscurior]|uniref:Uncharacterized protein n=1 Tax=Cardiocondyla obscurior TaxID=286306 RepID=A0AAW2G039_9HYME